MSDQYNETVEPNTQPDTENTKQNCCCACRQTIRSADEQRALINRLSRLEGQVRGIKKMVEQDAYCVDIMTQTAAVTAALNSFNKLLLERHIGTCFVEDLKQGKKGSVEELVALVHKLMR